MRLWSRFVFCVMVAGASTALSRRTLTTGVLSFLSPEAYLRPSRHGSDAGAARRARCADSPYMGMEPTSRNSHYFTFWALVKQPDGSYAAQPAMHIFPSLGLVEVFPSALGRKPTR